MLKRTIEAQEARLAVWMLVPSLAVVFSIVIFPVALNFWVSFKPVRLGDLRPPTPIVRERIEILNDEGSSVLRLRYQIRNSNPNKPVESMTLNDSYPPRLEPREWPFPFMVSDGAISLTLENMEGGYSQSFDLFFYINGSEAGLEDELLDSRPRVTAISDNILSNFRFTSDNYRYAISTRRIGSVMLTTILYAVFGSCGALFLGLCAALLVNREFPGRGIIRGLLLFPYVAPIVAVAFVWIFLLDPLSGTVNELLRTFGITRDPVSFLSTRPTALLSAIFFDAWRYFPFCYLFILARLKAIPDVLYESAEIEGAGPLIAFWRITLPEIREIMASVFLLRFIWTFNRFDDIFLLTGGAAGTQTLPIQVYDHAIGAGDIGAGAAASVILFIILTIFLVIFLSTNREAED